jgi:RNA polymerase sigma-70 factor (ECF subfamily)
MAEKLIPMPPFGLALDALAGDDQPNSPAHPFIASAQFYGHTAKHWSANCQGGEKVSEKKPIREWVLAAQKGDQKAFEELFRLFHGTVYNTALQLLGNPEDAEDVTQDAFLRAWEQLPKLTAPEAFRNWLLTITVNLCRSHFRKATVPTESLDNPPESEDAEEEPIREIADEGVDAEAIVLQRETARLVRRAVAELPLAFREVIVLHYFEGLELADIAKILRVPIGTVKSRLARAREQLRRKLERWL